MQSVDILTRAMRPTARRARYLSVLLLFAFVIACVLIDAATWRPWERQYSPLIISKPQIELGIVEPEAPIELEVDISNQATTEEKIVGASDRCGADGCVTTLELPRRIGANSTEKLKLHYDAPKMGRFRFVHTLYTSAASQPKIQIEITGQVGQRAEGPNTPAAAP